MAQADYIIEFAMGIAPGVLGALAATPFIGETKLAKFMFFVSGAASAYYAGGTVSVIFGLNDDLGRFLTGLFGMAIASKMFEFIKSTDAEELSKKLFGRWDKK